MGTRSTIALEYADGTVGQVYCHWDGYLENNGMILYKHYVDPFKTRELMDLGDISSLGKNIGEQHPFSPHFDEGSRIAYDLAQAQGATTFYGRDRGEKGVGQWRAPRIIPCVSSGRILKGGDEVGGPGTLPEMFTMRA